jgi:DNA-binding transcriptional MerR regulator
MAAPKRDLFKAAEVCEVANVQPYVLRSWEAEFPQLGRAPAGGGPKLYGREDVELVLRIKAMVFGEGLTLAGARRRLEDADDGPVDVPALLGQHGMLGPPGLADEDRARVRHVREGLRGLLELLSADEPALVLSAPSSAPRRVSRGRRRGGSTASDGAGAE